MSSQVIWSFQPPPAFAPETRTKLSFASEPNEPYKLQLGTWSEQKLLNSLKGSDNIWLDNCKNKYLHIGSVSKLISL